MKKTFLRMLSVVMASAAFACSHPDGYVLDMTITGFADSTRFSISDDSGAIEDTVMMIDGKLHYERKFGSSEPVVLTFFGPEPVVSSEYYSVFLLAADGYHETVTGSKEDMSSGRLVYKGAPWSDDMTALAEILGDSNAERDRLSKNFGTLTDEDWARYSALNDEIDSLNIAFIMERPNSYVSLCNLVWTIDYMTREQIQSVYDRLTPEYRGSSYARIAELFLNNKKIELGDSLSAYDIVGIDASGDSVRLSDVGGDYLLVDFSNYGCGYCIFAARDMAALKDRFADRVTMISYSCDALREMWAKERERSGIEWLSIWNGEGPRGETCVKYGVNGYPSFFVFGPDRTLVDMWFGYGKGVIENRLEALLSGKKVD